MIRFFKYHGAGNDFVIIDDRGAVFPGDNLSLVQQMCDRHFGIGADGLMLLRNHAQYDFEMVYYNADGRLSSMCGNGGRCITAFAAHLGMIQSDCSFLAVDGVHRAEVLAKGLVRLEMNDVSSLKQLSDRAFFLDTGSPHYVEWRPDVMELNLVNEARKIRYSDRWAQEGVNVNFITKQDGAIRIRTYERGVENETLACGTGVTAAAIVANASDGVSSPVQVVASGGSLTVQFDEQEGVYSNVWKTGPTALVFEGGYNE